MSKKFPSIFSSPEHSPGFLLWQLSNLWQRAQREALSPLGLTHVQFVLLASTAWLDMQGDEITQTKLAEQAKTDPMMTSQVMRVLESRQLVDRKRHPHDTRALVVSITEEGKKLVRQAIPVVEQVDYEFFSRLENKDIPSFSAMLRELISER